MDEPVIVGNLVPLCFAHHQDVTENKAWIRYSDNADRFDWWFKDDTITAPWMRGNPLDPQPPRLDAASGTQKGVSPRNELSPGRSQDDAAGSVESEVSEVVCDKCGRRKRAPREDLPPGEKRKRQSWNIKVPADAENGAEILDELCDELAEIFDMDHYTSQLQRYYVCAQAFVIVLQNKHLIGAE